MELDITIAGGPMPMDAYKAAIKKAEVMIKEYIGSEDNEPLLEDLVDAVVLAVGADAHQIHKFTATTTFATRTFVFTYVETASNVELFGEEE